ncbi:MAG: sulfite exporter TauE/SafE family protein [Burkholderiaceae bacterium]|nr:sulfite exporter TauE/SafE family protein [Burkholderiaceae bacterium]
MNPELLLLAGGAALGGFVQGVSGFAFGMVSMSVWVWGIDPLLAVQMTVFGGLFGQSLSALTVRRGLHLPLLLPFLAGGAIGVPLGLWALPWLSAEVFKLVVGSILLLFGPAMLLAERLPTIRRGGRLGDALAGMLGGLIGGVGGFTGAVPALWGILRGYTKDAHRAVLQNFNLAALTAIFAGHLASGAVTATMLPKFGLVALAVVLPSMLGARIYVGLSPIAFRRVVLVLLSMAGFAMLASALS